MTYNKTRNAHAQAMVNLNFYVRDLGGSGVSGLTVTIDQDFGNGTTRNTDGSGFANFGVNQGATIGYSIDGNSGGGSCSSNSGSVTASGDPTNVTVNLTCFTNLNFYVTDGCTGGAVSGATVNINQNFGNGTTRTTDAAGFANFGVYTFTNVGWGVSAGGYNSSSGVNQSGSHGGSTNVSVSLSRSCAAPTGTVCVNIQNNAPAYTVNGPTSWVGSNQSCFGGEPTGTYSVTPGSNACLTPSVSPANAYLGANSTIWFTITYANSCGTVNVSADRSTTWTLQNSSGGSWPGTGTSQSYSVPCNSTYSVTAAVIAGLAATVTPSSQGLTCQ